MRSVTIGLLLLLCLAGGMSVVQAAAPKADIAQVIRAMFGKNMPKTNTALGLNFSQVSTLLRGRITSCRVTPLSTGGFGDRCNSYAWASAVFNGDLYIGTLRYPEIQGFIGDMLHLGFPGAPLPEISALPDIPYIETFYNYTSKQLIADPAADAAHRFAIWNGVAAAEIWKFAAATRTWHLVYKAQYVPATLTDLYTPETRGFRKMDVFTDSTGRSAIFAFCGLSTTTFTQPQYMPLAYRSEDGSTWELVETLPEMGKNSRASVVHDGKLFIGGDIGNRPGLWYTEVANPTLADWHTVDTRGVTDGNSITSLASFDGRLHIGTGNPRTGFEVWAGEPNNTGGWTWEQLVTNGAIDQSNIAASTMKVFNNRLYVVSMTLPVFTQPMAAKGFDVIRIKPRNAIVAGQKAWELLVGGGTPVRPAPGYENVKSLSGWPSGFGNPLLFYGWSWEVFNGKLYLGTFDASVILQFAKEFSGQLPPDLQTLANLVPLMSPGADVWETSNGTTWRPINMNGFGSAYNYGIRNMALFDSSLVFMTSNPFNGCAVYQLGQ